MKSFEFLIVGKKSEHKEGSNPDIDVPAFCKKVSQNVKKLRTELGMTQEQLAFDMDVTKQFIQKIEIGQRNITLQTLLKLAFYLKTTPSALIDVL